MTTSVTPLRQLILRWQDDPGATYRTWFLWEERLKNFRSIRRGLTEVVREIEEGSYRQCLPRLVALKARGLAGALHRLGT